MLGYHNKPDATAETLVTDADGDVWLRTGDIAHVDDDGLCFITDRKKELIKSKGPSVFSFEFLLPLLVAGRKKAIAELLIPPLSLPTSFFRRTLDFGSNRVPSRTSR